MNKNNSVEPLVDDGKVKEIRVISDKYPTSTNMENASNELIEQIQKQQEEIKKNASQVDPVGV